MASLALNFHFCTPPPLGRGRRPRGDRWEGKFKAMGVFGRRWRLLLLAVMRGCRRAGWRPGWRTGRRLISRVCWSPERGCCGRRRRHHFKFRGGLIDLWLTWLIWLVLMLCVAFKLSFMMLSPLGLAFKVGLALRNVHNARCGPLIIQLDFQIVWPF